MGYDLHRRGEYCCVHIDDWDHALLKRVADFARQERFQIR
jgi:hypothetical protein